MILADTSIWVDHLRNRNPEMQKCLATGQIAMHPFIVAEIALGSLQNRQQTLEDMESLLSVRVAQLSEVRRMIEAHALYSKGIGLTDAHMIASCLLTPGTKLWTNDAAMKKVATPWAFSLTCLNPEPVPPRLKTSDPSRREQGSSRLERPKCKGCPETICPQATPCSLIDRPRLLNQRRRLMLPVGSSPSLVFTKHDPGTPTDWEIFRPCTGEGGQLRLHFGLCGGSQQIVLD